MPPLFDAGFVAGPVLVALAALVPEWRSGSHARHRSALPASAHLLVPYVPLVAVGLVVTVQTAARHPAGQVRGVRRDAGGRPGGDPAADHAAGEHAAAAAGPRRPAAARPPGLPRPAHRGGEPVAVRRPAGACRCRCTGATASRWRCCSATSTTSRRSTTASGTPPATSCSGRWPAGCRAASGRPTPSPGWAGTSSRCCWRAPTTRVAWSPGGCSRRCASRSSSTAAPRTVRRQRRAGGRGRRRAGAHRRPAAAPGRRGDVRGKRQGGGTVVGYRPGDTPTRADPDLPTGSPGPGPRLRAEPADGGLRVHYQPIVRLADGSTVAVEALARWTDPAAGRCRPTCSSRSPSAPAWSGDARRPGAGPGLPGPASACAPRPARLAVHVNVSAARLGDPRLERGRPRAR